MASGPEWDRGTGGGVRLQRVMADAGVAARRACERMIEKGRVRVNGKVVRALPAFVDPRRDEIMVDGRVLAQPERLVYVMLNKPPKTVATVRDEPGMDRRTVSDLVQHPSGVRLFPVGRLDYETRGLVLMTNDGDLANRLTHPRYGVHKIYRAEIKGFLDDEALTRLSRGIYLAERRDVGSRGARRTAEAGLELVHRARDTTVIDIRLGEGRNRQVRRMFAAVGCPVKRLTRVGMGPVRLKGLAVGQWRELTRQELNALRRVAAGTDTGSAGSRGPSSRGRNRPRRRTNGRER